MMNVNYLLCDPTGNITVLVTDEISKEQYKSVADALMTKEPTAQQVGFVIDGEGNNIVLNMAGGEFCGNATLSTAAYKNSLTGLKKINVKVSGCDETIEVDVKRENDIYTASADMPMPNSMKETTKTYNGKEIRVYEVDFGSIVHYIMEDEILDIEGAIKEWCEGTSLGLIFYDNEKNFMKPYVYVKDPYSFMMESSCASGTTALGFYLSSKANALVEKEINEPGGTLKIKAAPGEKVNLSGTVRFIK